MKSIVTGGGGFLGSYIVEELRKRGDEVVIVARGHGCDLRDERAVMRAFRGADRVFHVAARVGVWGPWNEFFETNVRGTENVIRACRENGIRHLIYTSSPSVVFDGRDHRGVDEGYPYPTKWLSPYAQTKKMAEERVLAAGGVALRPHLIWGKGDRYLIPRVIEQGRAGKLRRVGGGKNRVDIVHVVNAAKAHVQAAEKIEACAGKAYFLSQDEPVVLWDFIDEVLRRAKVAPVRKAISYQAAYQLGATLEAAYRVFSPGKEPRMTRFIAQSLAKDHYYDISAAKRDFGYRPEMSTQAGLDEIFGSSASSREKSEEKYD